MPGLRVAGEGLAGICGKLEHDVLELDRFVPQTRH
jgi:hypothetical protein